ncbi:DUF2169 domain-containing protein [Sorangium sp. So ce1099]|uniref:DUF2169 family type VI secretion system accessory protein n=1 Tax=Sorangium sp. So ce1099 TaxID=3133331 RepID=UPI003F63BFD8
MEVLAVGALPVASLLWQPRPDAWMLTFACKTTFALRPGESPLSPEQEPLREADAHWRDDPAWSLYASTDIVPIRPRVDVVLVGHAFAPGQAPVRSLVARLSVGELDKSIEVFCDRIFTKEGALREGQPFVRMPLLWERAARGAEGANAVGVAAGARDTYGAYRLPNLVPPGAVVSSPDDLIEPVGFGPIAPSWPARRSRLGRHAAAFSSGEWQRSPLPADLDASYFNAAPLDQQVAALRGDERIVLENLHPEHPRLVTRLAGERPQAFVERPGQAPQPVALRPDLLWIHTDRALCALTWRGQIPLAHPHEAGAVRVSMVSSPVSALVGAPSSSVRRESEPGEAREAPPAPASSDAGARSARRADRVEVPASTRGETVLNPGAGGATLPFIGSASGSPPSSSAQAASQRLTGTPFVAAPAPSSVRRPAASDRAAVPSQPAPAAGASAPPVAASPAVAAPPAVAPPAVAPPVVAPPAVIASPPVESPWAAGASRGGAALSPTIGSAAVQPAAAPPAAPSRPDPAPAPARTPAARGPAAARPVAAEIVHLLWFDPESVARVRRQPAFRPLLEELDERPLDREADEPALAKDPMAVEDHREIFEIIARAGVTDAEGTQETVIDAVRDGGKFVPPVCLLAGELIFHFDELEALKATVTAAAPLVGNDEQLRAAVAPAQDFLKLPELRSSPAVAEGLTARIKEAFEGKRVAPAGYLKTQAERALLDQRHYQRRPVFGGPHLRALLQPPGSSQQLPAYLPAALAQQLPLYQRFRARIVAELHLQVDQHESHPIALRVLALARVAPLPSRR